MAMLRGQHATEVAGGVLFQDGGDLISPFFSYSQASSHIISVQIPFICAGTECHKPISRVRVGIKPALCERCALELFSRLCALDCILPACWETASTRGDAADVRI